MKNLGNSFFCYVEITKISSIFSIYYNIFSAIIKIVKIFKKFVLIISHKQLSYYTIFKTCRFILKEYLKGRGNLYENKGYTSSYFNKGCEW